MTSVVDDGGGAGKALEIPGDTAIELVSVLRLQSGPPLKMQDGSTSMRLQYAVLVVGGHLEVQSAE